MTAWRDSVTLYAEIAFVNSPLTADASCTWVDVSDYVRNASIRRGRTTELSSYSPGTASIVLDNRDRLFDPSNSAGPYYGNLLPMKRIRIRATVGVTTATIFAGYVLGWPVEYPGFTDSTVTVSCVDAMRLLENQRLPDSAYSLEVLADSPTYYWPMQDLDAQAASYPRVGSDPLKTYPRSFAQTPAITTYDAPIGENRYLFGDVFANPSGLAVPAAIEFWTNGVDTNFATGPSVRVALGETTSDYAGLNVGRDGLNLFYSSTVANRWYDTSVTGDYVAAGAYRSGSMHVVLTFNASTMDLYLNGVLDRSVSLSVGTIARAFTAGTGVAVASFGLSNTAFSHLALYSTAPSAARIAAHFQAGMLAFGAGYGERGGGRIGRILDAVGWPAADRSISTGETVLDSWLPEGSSPLSACREIEDVEQGLFFIDGSGKVTFRDRQWQMTNSSSTTSQATFGDQSGETPYADIAIDGNQIDFVRNSVSVSYVNGTARAKDTSSVTAYGEQAESISGSLFPSVSAQWLSQQLAAFRLRLRKTPKTRVPFVVLKPRVATSTHLPTRLNLELGERVTVKRRPSGGTGSFDLACTVQGIADTITPDDWVTTFYLAPANPVYTDGPYLTLGDATYGKIGAVAGNTIPY